jgi:6-phosphogluconolactonase/glucosamine-6-phosphate isomerase/deaminase
MLKNTKLLKYLDTKNVRFFSVLENKSLEQTAKDYDETLRFLFNHFAKTVAIMGIGEDGHTAGIPVGVDSDENSDLVSFFTNFPSNLNERISLNFSALKQIDVLIVLVFGKEKQKALDKAFKKGSIFEIPARIFNQELDTKTILITDLNIKS